MRGTSCTLLDSACYVRCTELLELTGILCAG